MRAVLTIPTPRLLSIGLALACSVGVVQPSDAREHRSRHTDAKDTAAPAPTAPQSALKRIAQTGVVRVGMCAQLAPFAVTGAGVDELVKQTGENPAPIVTLPGGARVAGFDVELATELGRQLGAKVELVLVERFDALIPGLVDGRYDVVASGMTRTLQRAKQVAFSDPYFSSGIEIRVRDTAKHASLEALNVPLSRVAFRSGTTSEDLIARRLPKVTRIAIADREKIFDAFDDPTIDAIVIDLLVARDAEVRGRSKTKLVPLEGRRFSTENMALAVAQGDPDWLGWINLFLREAKAQGAFHRAAARYNAWFRTEN